MNIPALLPPASLPIPTANPALLQTHPFNPLLPPPTVSRAHPLGYAKRELPKVSLRFVEDSAPCSTTSTPSQQTLADRVASIFGCDTPQDASNVGQSTSNKLDCDDVDDMDVDVGSSISPAVVEASSSRSPSEAAHFKAKHGLPKRRNAGGTSGKQKRRFMRNVNLVCEATEKVIGEEIVDVITKDFYKRIEGVSFEILEEVLAEMRRDLEEQKRNEVQLALREQAEIVTREKPSDVSQLCSPFAASLNATHDKLGSFPFTINMPKLPSFRRKIRPPSPESESSQSPVGLRYEDSDADNSDAAQKSSSDSPSRESESGSCKEIVLSKKERNREQHSSPETESSSHKPSSDDAGSSLRMSSISATSTRAGTPSIDSIAISTASSIASSSESSPRSDDDDRDASTATEEPCIAASEQTAIEKPKEIPLWQKILADSSPEWAETLPVSLYHINLTEHCYFKLPESDDQLKADTSLKKTADTNAAAPLVKGRLNKHDRELLALFPSAEFLPKPKPQIVYPPWSPEERKRHIEQWDCCFDPEDQEYLKQAWMEIQPPDENALLPPWRKPLRFNVTSWSNKPRLLDKPIRRGGIEQYFDDEELDGIIPLPDGCARTRGYFKMSMKEKRRLIRRPEDEQCIKTVISDRDEAAVRHNLVVTKESRSMHRRLLTTMGDTNTDFFKVNQLKYRRKMIKFARSRIHGWGLYAMETIAPDDMIVEYVGQKVRNTVAEVREKAYERRGIGSSYLFRIDDTTVIDATRMGNFARFINHSCQPNCYAKVVTVDGDKRIVIYSKTVINKGDEITYDYKFPIEEDKVDCLCGAPNCRGTLN